MFQDDKRKKPSEQTWKVRVEEQLLPDESRPAPPPLSEMIFLVTFWPFSLAGPDFYQRLLNGND